MVVLVVVAVLDCHLVAVAVIPVAVAVLGLIQVPAAEAVAS